VHAGLATERYLADGALAGRGRECPTSATPMFFAVRGTATVTVWANGSHIAQANKPRPLDPIGGSTE
jgi:hypothetical protein